MTSVPTPPGSGVQPLSPAGRRAALARLTETELDILVIGGGVTGAGAALDAVTRGLRVGLVEARDYAAGTSSRSSKLIHGGLRYLEQLNFALVREALAERSLILGTLCPHLAHPVPFLIPLHGRVWERLYIGSGVLLYDAMGGRHAVPAHKHLSRRRARELFPSLRKDALIGAIEYYDGQVDDARHTAMVARTAAAYGASVVNSARVTGFVVESDRVVGAHVTDLETGERVVVRAKEIINAAGVWTDEIQDMIGGRGQISVRASKGVHLVVPRNRIRGTTGLLARTEKSVLFVIPWGSHWLVGTTDTDWALDLAHPAASEKDIDYLLEHVNALLTDPLTRDDVVGVYAGLRPLLSGESDSTSSLSREHAVVSPMRGLTLIAGGKYTTYRIMARDAVDSAVHGLERKVPPSCTDTVPLLGATGYQAALNARESIAAESGVHVAWVEHLLGRYGTLLPELLALIETDGDLGRPLESAPDYLRVEAVYAASHEGALHLDDVLTRRTRISIETWDRGHGAAREVADLVAPVLGWSDEDARREVEHYRARVAAERESQHQGDDQTADAARLGAPDVRGVGASAGR